MSDKYLAVISGGEEARRDAALQHGDAVAFVEGEEPPPGYVVVAGWIPRPGYLLCETIDAAEARTGVVELAARIDAETSRRTSAGYEWPVGSGVWYSSSLAAQTTTLGLSTRIARGHQTYPQSISRLDGSVGWLRSEDEALDFIESLAVVVKGRLDYGRALRAAVLDAATPDARAQTRRWADRYLAGETPDLEGK